MKRFLRGGGGVGEGRGLYLGGMSLGRGRGRGRCRALRRGRSGERSGLRMDLSVVVTSNRSSL